MPIIILHGEHHVQSRTELVRLMTALKDRQRTLHQLEASTLDVATVESLLGTQSLFGEEFAIIIQELLSLPKSKKRDQLVDLVVAGGERFDIVLWEKKKLTAAQAKAFKGAKIQEFKISPATFQWLDHLHSKNLKQQLTLLQAAVKQDGVDFCVAMLQRQVKMLLTAKVGGKLSGHPFMVQKTTNQAKHFSTDQLIDFHEKLTKMDYHLKTGQLRLPLQQSLEQLFIHGI